MLLGVAQTAIHPRAKTGFKLNALLILNFTYGAAAEILKGTACLLKQLILKPQKYVITWELVFVILKN
jgi:hypothetical protein